MKFKFELKLSLFEFSPSSHKSSLQKLFPSYNLKNLWLKAMSTFNRWSEGQINFEIKSFAFFFKKKNSHEKKKIKLPSTDKFMYKGDLLKSHLQFLFSLIRSLLPMYGN